MQQTNARWLDSARSQLILGVRRTALSAVMSGTTESKDAGPAEASAWPAALASLIFSGTTYFLFQLYSFVHWRLWVRSHREKITASWLNEGLVSVLAQLDLYRVFGVLAFGWALWALRDSPRWAGAIALVVSLGALFLTIVVQ